MMHRAVALSRTPGEPDRGRKLSERSKIAGELLSRSLKFIWLRRVRKGGSAGHSLSGATSVTLIHCQDNARFSALS